MGYMTVVGISNDALTNIEKNPEEFTQKIVYLASSMLRKDDDKYVSVGCHANPVHLISCHHNDSGVIMINCAGHSSILGYSMNGNHHKIDERVKIVKELARQYGYKLVKDPSIKKPIAEHYV